MIEKAIAYKKTDKDFISSLKKLGLSKDEINFILRKHKRKKFEEGGDSGPGGSDDGTGHGGPGPGSPGGPGGAETGFGIGPDAAAEAAASNAAAAAAAAATSGYDGFGIGPNAEAEAAASNAAAAAQANALAQTLEDQVNREQNPATARLSPLGVTAYNMSLTNPEKSFSEKAMGFVTSPFSTALATAYDAYARGVTAPDDYSQLDTSVQNPAPSTSPGGGITTLPQYAPLTNVSTGDNTADSIRTRLENLLVQRPTSYGIPAANQLSNYNLLDLVNLRR